MMSADSIKTLVKANWPNLAALDIRTIIPR